jgi:hypothetical protein
MATAKTLADHLAVARDDNEIFERRYESVQVVGTIKLITEPAAILQTRPAHGTGIKASRCLEHSPAAL